VTAMSDGTPTRRELWIDAREDPKVYLDLAREHGLPVALGPDEVTVDAEARGYQRAMADQVADLQRRHDELAGEREGGMAHVESHEHYARLALLSDLLADLRDQAAAGVTR
jgi:hypothetical protein